MKTDSRFSSGSGMNRSLELRTDLQSRHATKHFRRRSDDCDWMIRAALHRARTLLFRVPDWPVEPVGLADDSGF
jgi:hypothetical protein